MDRLKKQIGQNEKMIDGLKKKMNNPSYATKVPEEVKAENAKKLELYEEEHAKLSESLEELSQL